MRTICLVVSIFLSLFTLRANAQAFSEHLFYEFDLPPEDPFLVECLGGQNLDVPLHVTVTQQTTVTPSGRLHFHDNWRVEGIWISEDSNEWYAHGVWPYRENLELPGTPNESQIAASEKLMIIADPIGDNPYPKLKASLVFKFVQNGNGETVVEESKFSPPSCIGRRP